MRDLSLDLLKGVACILMLLAHTQLQIDLPSKAMTFLGSFAPILFFAVSGITANFQARKYPVTGIVITYAMIFLLGLSFAAMVTGNVWVPFDMDILQIIAVGVLTLYLVQRFLNPGHWYYLGAAVLLFALKLVTDSLRDTWWMASLAYVVVEPGNFVIIPWLFPFFLGMFCYLAPNRHNVILAGTALLAMGVAWGLGLTLGIDNRWDMTIGYFLFALFLTSATFYSARRLPHEFMARAFPPLIWLGKYSLLFLYVHIAVIWLVRHYTHGIWGTYWVWAVVGAASIALMWVLPPLLGALRIPALMARFPAWIALLILVLAAPLVMPPGTPLVLTEFALGLVFSLYYATMTQVLKGVTWPAARPTQSN
ncbi:acyltransferase family protein [uncultured Thiodictyon sp.]|uniref:acyltransferase family protein n=1 Tax=uncultured Thiodictyon sp. TaxID=1846217 RepID=UPI0025FF3EE7|nr:acyltransferase family protein [uncultured Thiodictyon sp.]